MDLFSWDLHDWIASTNVIANNNVAERSAFEKGCILMPITSFDDVIQQWFFSTSHLHRYWDRCINFYFSIVCFMEADTHHVSVDYGSPVIPATKPMEESSVIATVCICRPPYRFCLLISTFFLLDRLFIQTWWSFLSQPYCICEN